MEVNRAYCGNNCPLCSKQVYGETIKKIMRTHHILIERTLFLVASDVNEKINSACCFSDCGPTHSHSFLSCILSFQKQSHAVIAHMTTVKSVLFCFN